MRDGKCGSQLQSHFLTLAVVSHRGI